MLSRLAAREQQIRDLESQASATRTTITVGSGAGVSSSEAQEQIPEAEARIHDLETKIHVAEARIRDLEAEIQRQADALHQAQNASSQTQQQIRAAQARVHSLETTVQQQADSLRRIPPLETRIQQQDIDLRKQVTTIADRDNLIDQLHSEIQHRRETIRSQAEDIRDRDERLDNYREEVEQLRPQVVELARACIRQEARVRIHRAVADRRLETIAELQSDRDIVQGVLERVTGSTAYPSVPLVRTRDVRDSLSDADLPLARLPDPGGPSSPRAAQACASTPVAPPRLAFAPSLVLDVIRDIPPTELSEIPDFEARVDQDLLELQASSQRPTKRRRTGSPHTLSDPVTSGAGVPAPTVDLAITRSDEVEAAGSASSSHGETPRKGLSRRDAEIAEMFGSPDSDDVERGSRTETAQGGSADDDADGDDNQESGYIVEEYPGSDVESAEAPTEAVDPAAPSPRSFGQHSATTFHRLIDRVFDGAGGSLQRYWAAVYHVARAAHVAVPADLPGRHYDPLLMLLPEDLQLYPPPSRRPPPPARSMAHLHALLALLDSEPWGQILQGMPDPVSFDHGDRRYATLWRRLKAWREVAASIVWLRCHWLRLSDFIPVSTAGLTRADLSACQRARDFDRKAKNQWSHRIRSSRDLLDEVRRLTAEGMLDARVFLDPAFLVLPLDSARYFWSPDFSAGAPSLETQLATLDAQDPWRLYYAARPDQHPVRRYHYAEIDDMFPIADPAPWHVPFPDRAGSLRVALDVLCTRTSLPANTWRRHLTFDPTPRVPGAPNAPARASSGQEDDSDPE